MVWTQRVGAGAPLTPKALYLLPEPQWSLVPGNLSNRGELYVAE